jgi:endonuclease III
MKEETPENKRERALKVLDILKATYPDAHVTLDYRNAFELLVAAVLAAQCTDEKVNQVTPALFRKYPSPQAFAEADEAELQTMIRQTGFFRQKARSIMDISQELVGSFGGKVPDTMDELTSLRGVGRKTANLILGEVYDKPGIVVDTHVKRVTARLGFTENTDPTKIEFDLMEVLPEERWTEINHLIVYHGRAICKAPTPFCEKCPVLELCPFGRERMKLA